jgi:hypothetical protein
MEEMIAKYLAYIEPFFSILGSIVLIATAIVRLTPSPKDDKILSKIAGYIWKIADWLPTIGVNPKTKNLKSAYDKLELELKADKEIMKVKEQGEKQQ